MSVLPTRYTELVGIEHPIIQEGMGPFKTVALAAAVSNAARPKVVARPQSPSARNASSVQSARTVPPANAAAAAVIGVVAVATRLPPLRRRSSPRPPTSKPLPRSPSPMKRRSWRRR